MPKDVAISFIPFGTHLNVPRGTSLLKAITQAGYPVGYSCRGQGVCVACAVWVQGQASKPSGREIELLRERTETQKRGDFSLRISCLTRAKGSVRVTTDYW